MSELTRAYIEEAVREAMLCAHNDTRRDLLAGMVMQGMLAAPTISVPIDQAPQVAVRFADALIAELDKPRST